MKYNTSTGYIVQLSVWDFVFVLFHDCLRITGALSSIKTEFSTTLPLTSMELDLFFPLNIWALTLSSVHLAQFVFAVEVLLLVNPLFLCGLVVERPPHP